jgi:hypothetical protein
MNHIRAVFVMFAFAASMLLGVTTAVTPANAALITFNFTGTVTAVGSNLGGTTTFSNGQTLTGSYTFNSATADSNGGPTIGTYNGTISNLVVNIGSYSATLGAGTNFIQVKNLPTSDSYTMQAPFSGATVNGHTPQLFGISLVDPTHTAFGNDHLPTTAPNLGSFATKDFRLVFNGGPTATVSGVLTSLTAVPLPAAVILFGAGLIALVGLGAGSWRQKKHSFTSAA